MSLELPFGIKPVNPVAVDYYSGPWSGNSTQEAINSANSGIPSAVRFTGLTANLIVGGEAKKYWYASGVSDSHLVAFADTLFDGNVSIVGDPSGVAFFSDQGVITTDTFVWNSGSDFLGIGTSNPAFDLDVVGNVRGSVSFRTSAGGFVSTDFLNSVQSAGVSTRIHLGNSTYGLNKIGFRANSTDVMGVTGTGVGIYTDSPEAALHIHPNTSNSEGLLIRGLTAQTANLTEWQDDLGSVLAHVDSGGNAMFRDLTVDNMTVSGTFTYVNSENVTIADKQIELASNSGTAIGGDSLADQGGIVVKSTDGDKSFLWDQSSNAWTSNKNLVVQGTITNPAMQTFVNNNALFNNDVNITNDLLVSGNTVLTANLEIRGRTSTTETYLSLKRDNDTSVLTVQANGTSATRIQGDHTFDVTTDTTTGTLSLGNYNGRHGVQITNEGYNVGIGRVIPSVDGVTIGRAEHPVMLNGSGTFIYNNNDVDETNYERLEIKWDTDKAYIETTAAGTGTQRSIEMRAGGDTLVRATASEVQVTANGSLNFQASTAANTFYKNIAPNTDSSRLLGSTSRRWANIYGNAIDLESNNSADTPAVIAGATLQSANLTEWQNSAGDILAEIDATGQMNIYNSGGGTNDYERLEIKWDTNTAKIGTTKGGTGSNRELYLESDNTVRIRNNGATKWIFSSSQASVYQKIIPAVNNSYDLGSDSFRWATTYTTDLSAAGTIDAEVGGQFNSYNVGTDGDANYERLEMRWDTNVAYVEPTAGGTGTVRAVGLKSDQAFVQVGSGRVDLYSNGSANFFAAGTSNIAYKLIRPSFDNTLDLGQSALRWANIYGNAIDLQAANATDTPAIIAGATLQSDNLTEWQNSAGDILAEIDATGQMNIYNSGGGTNDYERLEVKWDSDTATIDSTAAGTGTARAFDISYNGARRFRGGQSFAYIYGATGGYIFYGAGALKPQSANSIDLGGTNNRWSKTYSVDGSFSGDLVVEDGGTFNLFGLGDSHTNTTDTQFLQISSTSASYSINSAATGTGVSRDIYMSVGGTSNLMLRSDHTRFMEYIRPQTTDTIDIGTSSFRFRNIYGNAIDLQAANATDTPAIITGATLQSANLTEWQDSAGNTLAHVGSGGTISTSGDLVANQYLKFLGGNGPYISSTASYAYLRNSLGQSRIRWGSDAGIMVFVGITPNTGNTYDIGENGNRTFRSLYLGTSVHSSGVQTSGVYLNSHVPASTTNMLYNDGGELKWNGAGITPTGTPSGVSFFGDDGVLTEDSNFVFSSGDPLLKIRVSGDATNNVEWRIGDDPNGNSDAYHILLGPNGTANITNQAHIGIGGSNPIYHKYRKDNATLQSIVNGNTRFSVGMSSSTLSTSLYPNSTADSHDLGKSNYVWGQVYGGKLISDIQNATDVGVTVKGAAAQSANLTEWQDSAGEILANVSSDGNITTSGDIVATGDVLVGNYLGWVGDPNTFIRNHNNNDFLIFMVGGLSYASMVGRKITFNGNANQDIDFIAHYNGGRGIDMDGATGSVTFGKDIYVPSGSLNGDSGSFVGNLNVETGGGFKVFSSGDSSSADSEYFKIDTDTSSVNLGTFGDGNGDGADLYIYRDGASYLELNSAGTQVIRSLIANVDGSPNVGRSDLRFGTVYSWNLDAESHNTTAVPLNVKGAAAQSANLTEWQASDGTAVAIVEPDGSISSSGDISASGSLRSSRFMASDDGSLAAPAFSFDSDTGAGMYRAATYQLNIVCGANYGVNISPNNFAITSGTAFGWRTGNSLAGGHSFSTQLHQESNGVIGQYSEYILEHYTPQQYNIYNYWGGNTSNWERLETKWESHTAKIQTTAAGSGVVRDLVLNGNTVELQAGGATRLTLGTDNKSNVNLRPQTNNSLELGSRFLRWRSIYSAGASHGLTTISTDATLEDNNNVVLCDASSGTITVTLPAPANYLGFRYHIKKTDSSSNMVTISPDGSETIDGQSSYVVNNQYESITLVCDGSNWFII